MTAAARKTKDKGRKDAAERPPADVRGDAGIPTSIGDLAPTARELLEAARRLLEAEGYSSLTLKAIGREAGQNESLIGYHFGNKTGLLVALMDWLAYDIVRDLHARVPLLEEGQDQVGAAIDDARKLITDTESYRAFYDLTPHLLATRDGRRRMAELYVSYREMNARALTSGLEQARSPRARAFASMHVALTDGLALQLLMDPGSVDVQLTLELWEECVRHVLDASPTDERRRAATIDP